MIIYRRLLMHDMQGFEFRLLRPIARLLPFSWRLAMLWAIPWLAVSADFGRRRLCIVVRAAPML